MVDTREDVIKLLARASLEGYLGLFVGTGFSKAVTNGLAPNFKQLLVELMQRLSIKGDIDNDLEFRHRSYPQIASLLLSKYKDECNDANSAPDEFREQISNICNLTPNYELYSNYSQALKAIRPSWIITTNYDLLLEALLEDAVSLLANQPLIARPDRVPIYHLHGHRLHPKSIKITEEDYITLIGPIDYQRLKLPLLFLESTTLMLGYALGDINVRAAIEWSSSFKTSNNFQVSSIQGTVVQALYVSEITNEKPYVGANGEIIIEIHNLLEFLQEIGRSKAELEEIVSSIRKEINSFLSDTENALALMQDQGKKDLFLNIIGHALPYAVPTRLIDFLSKILDPIWEDARKDDGWEYYNIYLSLLLDIFERIDVSRINPTVFAYLVHSLERVSWFLKDGYYLGYAWKASETWKNEHDRISNELKKEIYSYAMKNGLMGIISIFNMINYENT